MNENERLAKIALLYYEYHLTQEEIASRFGISRSQVSRLLKKAMEKGLLKVKVEITDPIVNNLRLAEEIKKTFNLTETIIVQSTDAQNIKGFLGKATAFFLYEELKDGLSIGVSWGTTLFHVTLSLYQKRKNNICVVPLTGGFGKIAVEYHSNEIARRIAETFEGEWFPLYAPALLENKILRDQMVNNAEISGILNIAKNVDIALVGIGAVSEDSILVTSGYLSKDQMQYLKQINAVGDILGHFFNKSGKPLLLPEIEDRIIGISFEDLLKIPKVVAVAGGIEKTEAIKGALNTSVIDVLITDDGVARLLVG